MRKRIWKKRTRFGVVCATLAITALPAGPALGEPPPGDGQYAADVTVRGAAGDVLLGDSGFQTLYSTANTFSRLIDRDYLSTDGYADQFMTKPFKPRYFKIHTPAVNGGNPLSCPSANGIVSVFSGTTPNWINDVGVGSSAVGNAYINCFLDKGQTKGWLITYPNTGSWQGECVRISNLGDADFDGRAEWSFSADASCPADVFWRQKTGGGYQKTPVGAQVAAPFEVHIEIHNG